jgi:LysM repeat protein
VPIQAPAAAPVKASATFEPQGGGQLQDSLEKVLESIRQEAQKLMGGGKAEAPAFTLPGMDQILADLVKKYPITQPTPMPPAPPQPKPAPKPEPKPDPKNPGGTYTVKPGDSLSGIAGRVLGNSNRWREIFELNRDRLSDPNKIFPGQVLKLPGGGNTPAPAPAPGHAPSGNAHDRRNNWYISQYGSKWNTNEDVPGYDNGNCGPTSLTMVAKAFGKISPNAAQADAAIEESRRRMGDGMNERSGTSVAGIARGAKSYGLSANTLWNANSGTIAQELAKGRLVIVHGTVIKDDGRVYGGHYYVVTKIEGGKAYLSDPAYPSGPRVISASLLDKSIATRGTRAMISVGP